MSVHADRRIARDKIKTPHPNHRWASSELSEKSAKHVERLTSSMKANGWDGLPLLVHEFEGGFFQAWMGMHRLEAAAAARVSEIPVVIVTREQLLAIGFSDQEIANDPWTFRARLAKLGDQRPHQLMQAEDINQGNRKF